MALTASVGANNSLSVEEEGQGVANWERGVREHNNSLATVQTVNRRHIEASLNGAAEMVPHKIENLGEAEDSGGRDP